jgi:hypothetical protein
VNKSRLPIEFKQAVKVIEKGQGRNKIQRVGLAVTEDEIIYRGNYPLRNHSGQLELIYNKKTQKMTMTGHFLGQSHEGRWGFMAGWLDLLNHVKKLSLARPVTVDELEITFAWDIDPNNIGEAMKRFFELGEFSNDSGDWDVLMDGLIAQDPTMTAAVVDYCLENPLRFLSSRVLERLAGGQYAGLNQCSPEKAKSAAKKLLEFHWGNAELALSLLRHERISHSEIAEILAPYSDGIRVSLWQVCPLLGISTEETLIPTQAELESPDVKTKIRAQFHMNQLWSRIGQGHAVEGLPPAIVQRLIDQQFRSQVVFSLYRQGYISSAQKEAILHAHFDQIPHYDLGPVVYDESLPLTMPTAEDMRHENPWIACGATRRLRLLVERGEPEAIALAKEILKDRPPRRASENVYMFLDQEWTALLSAGLKQNVLYEEAVRYFLAFGNNDLRTAIYKCEHPAILSTVLAILDIPQLRFSREALGEMTSIINNFVLRGIGLKEIVKRLPLIAESSDIAPWHIAGLMERLLKRSPEPEIYQQVTTSLLKVVSESSEDFYDVLKMVLKKGYAVKDLEKLAVARLRQRDTAYEGLQLFKCLLGTGHGQRLAKQIADELLKDPTRQSDAAKLFQLLPMRAKVTPVVW